MFKKFFSALMLVFAFLFLNMGSSVENVKAEELPPEVFDRAGWGEKMNYWAIINFGAEYVGSQEITIDIQQEAVANPEVNYIAIVESGYTSQMVYYQRNVNPEFSSRIRYTMRNPEYIEKSVTVLLLRELQYNPSDTLIVDKIIISVDQKRNIGELTADDILIIRENENPYATPYKVHVTLPDVIEGKGRREEYVFKSVKYTLLNVRDPVTINALYGDINNYYFTVYQNGFYKVEIEDVFGYRIEKIVEIDNLSDPGIIIKTYPETTDPINRDYPVDVEVIYFDTGNTLNSADLSVLEVSFNDGVPYSIKDNMQFMVGENGIYTIYARTLNGEETEVTILIDNIDKENPFAQVLSEMWVYTESVNLFTPENEIFYRDNVSPIERMTLELTFYSVIVSDGENVIGRVIDMDYRQYLYTVRDLIVRYKVTDEAGNFIEKDMYVKSIDDTIPTISRTVERGVFYINDPYPTAAELKEYYGLIESDNSVFPGSGKTITFNLDFSELPANEENHLNALGEYRIFVRAVDEAGNMSVPIYLTAEVRARLIKIEADADQYIVYGDIEPEDIVIAYHCITRAGEKVPCSQELLEGDAIIGDLYVLNARFVGEYEIFYDNIRVPSDLYYLDYGTENIFTVKPRTIRVIAEDKQKFYLDEDPELTSYVDQSVCEAGAPVEFKDYRCTFMPGDRLDGELERYMGDPPLGVEVWYDAESWSVSEAVWYDAEGNVVPRDITIGSLYVFERFNGGVDNYVIDFVGADFLILQKGITVYLEDSQKIYGEFDPEFEIRECRGEYPIGDADIDFCRSELRITLTRIENGEIVLPDGEGYEITGVADNLNYNVIFVNSNLKIVRRKVSISVWGDLDDDLNATGKYTIYYEDPMPNVTVYDSSVRADEGLANNQGLSVPVEDKFYYGEAAIYDSADNLVEGYVGGIGLYSIRKGSITIVDKDDLNAENNYDITFIDGQLEVIRKSIWIKIIRDLGKIYGDDDPYFDTDDLDGYDDYVILEANGRFILEITPVELDNGDPYIPRDNENMRYHIAREEGIYVGDYAISIQNLEGCENYVVNLFDDYKFTISQRDIDIVIDNKVIIYKDIISLFTYNEEEARRVLQYNDRLAGAPESEPYHNVGTYNIDIGTLRIVNEHDEDVGFNYNFTVVGGTLKVIQREVVIEVKEGQGKRYGDNDPKIEFNVYHNGVREEMDEVDYSGELKRDPGEIPDRYYMVNIGSFRIELNGEDDNGVPIGNYLITEFNNEEHFYIAKREITVTALDVTILYGNIYGDGTFDGTNYLLRDTHGDLAYNLALQIDGVGIHDIIVGNLKILGVNPDDLLGVGTYTISCEDLTIVNFYTSEDLVDKGYYIFDTEDGVLTVNPRTIYITPDDGQSKLYGEDDPVLTFTYSPENMLLPGDTFSGALARTPRNENGEDVLEDFGEYKINLGTLTISNNYQLVLNGSRTFVILRRTLNVSADSLTVEYGDPFELTYTIKGDGLANNPSLGIVDRIEGMLNLDRAYTGYGTYSILGDYLVITNLKNYNYTFSPGVLVVNKKRLIVTPEPAYKVYGEEDPALRFTLNASAAYTGKLSREPGEAARKSYKINLGDLNFGENYEVTLEEGYLTILARRIEINAENNGKFFGEEEPELVYTYTGTLADSDKIKDRFYSSLYRVPGETAGDYEILFGKNFIKNMVDGSDSTDNYDINIKGIFSIRYAAFESITIYSLTNNQYQIKGDEEVVKLYARFNRGADESKIDEVVWKIVKNDSIEWEFSKDTNNIVSFVPSGSVGTYLVSASYGGLTAYYEVYVELSTIGNVYIRYVRGEINQMLGKESELVYEVIVPESTNREVTVQWLINGTAVSANKISDSVYFFYTPNLGKGEYTVQAKIGSKVSEPLYFYVKNNNPPVITLNGDSVVYIEARTSEKYKELGAVAIDDVDGDISDKLVITGYVNEDEKGTYYIKYDVVDSHGNHAISVYRQVVVRDTTPPTVELVGNSEIKLMYGESYVEQGAIATDNYDFGLLEVTINNPIIFDKIGIYEVTYIAYDSSGNRGVAVRTVEIIDNISPLITLIGDKITYVEVYTEFKDEGAHVHDNVDGDFIIQATSFYYGSERVDSIDTSRLGTYYARYDYTDTAGNIGAGQERTIIVRDSTPPVITLNGTNPFIIRYAYPDINYVEPGAVAIDNYDEEVDVTITGSLGNELGSYYLFYDAIDAHGNRATTVVREVIVVDISNPIIHFFDRCPQYMTIEALYEEYDERCDMAGYGIWVEDDYQEDIEEIQKRIVVRGTVDDTTVGLYVITYDVVDMAGNAAVTLSRYVEVVDTKAPVISLIGGGANGEQIVEVFTSYEELGANVYDKYDLHHGIDIELTIKHNINVNRLGEYTVTYNAKDSNGNKAEPVIRKVFVKDTTPPEITLIGENPITIERGLPYVEYGAVAIDNYDGPLTNISILHAPSGMRLGSYEVIYRAIDSSGNIGEAIRYVDVVDTIPPIVLGVEDGKYYKNPVSIYFIPTLGTDEVLTGWLNGVEITSPYYLEAEGEYDLLVRDDAGNETRIWFAIDTTPPEILGVKNGEYTNREIVEIYSNERIKYFEYRYQSGDWVRIEEQNVSLTVEGTYRIYAVDMADNVSTVVMFVIDRTPPQYTLTGVLNKGITDTDVQLIVEEGADVVVNSTYNIPTLYTFTNDGYYQVSIRDLANNTVVLQFVINKGKTITVNDKIIRIFSQHNAIDKVSISGTTYPRNSGLLIVSPLIEGGFKYISGKLFSEADYQKLLRGETIEFGVGPTDDTFMYAAFVVDEDELNKFGTQIVDGENEGGGNWLYIFLFIFILCLLLFLFIFFLKRRKEEEEEEEDDETIIDHYY